MASGVETDGHATDGTCLAVSDPFGMDRAQSVADNGQGLMGRQIGPMAGAGVVRMSMGDQRLVHRAPRIDVKSAIGAIDAFVGKAEDGRCHDAKIARMGQQERCG